LLVSSLRAVAYEVVSAGKPNEYLKWGASHSAGTSGGLVTWGFLAAGTPGDRFCSIYCAGRSVAALPHFYRHPEINDLTSEVSLVSLLPTIQAAFGAWSEVADVQFQYVGVDDSLKAIDDPAATAPMIRIGAFAFDGMGAYFVAGVAFAPPPNGNSGAGEIFFNTNVGYQDANAAENCRLQDFPIGGGRYLHDIYETALHEIGHALGLKDSADPNAVMSHGAGSAGLAPSYRRRGPGADDIAGALYLYGPPRAAVGDKVTN